MKKTDLSLHLKARPEQLKKAKAEGIKIIGTLPGNYVPEEIIYASGAIPVCLVHGGLSEAADAALDLIKDFRISGVLWYELIGCETYDTESYFFEQKLREHGIPMLTIESDYGTSDLGQIGVQIEAFTEQIKGV